MKDLMVISLSEDWRIHVVPMNFILEERVESGIGPGGKVPKEPYKWMVRGYYSSVKAALSAMPDHLMQSPSVETYQGFLARWSKLCDAFARRVGG